jgi:DNA excision repair protein ERCC-4
MKALYVKKLYLWPRFQLTVSEALDKFQPEVIELTQPLTENMKAIQGAVLVAMKSCIAELKKAVPQLDTFFMSLENGLFKSFDLALKAQLDPEWHKLSPRTKQLVNDVGQLRKLLDYLLRYV